MVRGVAVTLSSLLAVGCFAGPDAGGLPCGPTLACPGDQVCSLDGVCVRIGGGDAGRPDGNGDSDSDGLVDTLDNCPQVANPSQVDEDGDGLGDRCDLCPMVEDRDQANRDGDGVSDACDPSDETFETTLRFWGFDERDPPVLVGAPSSWGIEEGALVVLGDGLGGLGDELPTDQGTVYVVTAAEVRAAGMAPGLGLGLFGSAAGALCGVSEEPAGLVLAAVVNNQVTNTAPTGVPAWGAPTSMLLQVALSPTTLGCMAWLDTSQPAGPITVAAPGLAAPRVLLSSSRVEARLEFVWALATRAAP